MKRIGAVAIARTTFDMPFAEANAAAAFDVLTGLEDTEVITTRTVAVDDETLRLALEPLEAEQLHAVVVIQATFADSTMAAAIAEAHEAPLVLWAIPEPRRGGRLRANSFCGINLAAYVLRRSDRAYRFLIADPTDHATSAKVSKFSYSR